MEFENKVAIITGSTGGIGSATAASLSSQGAKVCLIDLDIEKLRALAQKLNLNDSNCILMACDVRDESLVKGYVNAVMAKFGRIDIFVNNAGIEGPVSPIHLTDSKDLDMVLDINIKGVFYGMKYVIPVMQAQKSGSIINTSSVAGFIGSPGSSVYVASKHAVIGLTKTAALETAEFGIRVNAVCPGPVDNDMMKKIEEKVSPENPEAVKESFNNMVPLGRYATNEEVADLIAFFASEKSKYITGTAQRIDGGMGAK